MFPSGHRPAESPREVIAKPNKIVPSQVSAMPIFPARRPSPRSPATETEVETAGLIKVSVEPIRTWCEAVVRCAEVSKASSLRPLASEMLKATIEPVNAVIAP